MKKWLNSFNALLIITCFLFLWNIWLVFENRLLEQRLNETKSIFFDFKEKVSERGAFSTSVGPLKGISLDNKLIIRQYYSSCRECEDSVEQISSRLSHLVGKENTVFLGANYEYPNFLVKRRVSQLLYDTAFMDNSYFSSLDSMKPPKSYAVLVNEGGLSDFYLLEGLTMDQKNLILNDLERKYKSGFDEGY